MELKEMSLRECGKFDHEKGARNKLTGWGMICRERHELFKARYGEDNVKNLTRAQKRLVK